MMPRRSPKLPVPSENDQTGCIWGLVCIFDSRYGRSTRKLLSYKGRGSKRNAGVGYPGAKLKMLTNSDGISRSEISTANVMRTTSMKELIEEEMFCVNDTKKHTNRAQLEPHAVQLTNSPNGNLDMHPENSCQQVIEQKSLNNIDLLVGEPSNSTPLDHINSKHHNFFWRKSKESNPLKGKDKSQPKDKIVILKPGAATNEKNNSSHFSFTEIKRKLKHAMGKERYGIVHNKKISLPSENGDVDESIGKDFYAEGFAIKRTDKVGKSSKINVEAKKHILDMLNDWDRTEIKNGISSKTLGRILSIPEYDFSPRRSDEILYPSPLREEPKTSLEVIDENIQSPKLRRDVSDEFKPGDLVQETQSSMRDEGVVESLKTNEIEYQQDSKVLDVLSEIEVWNEEIPSQCLDSTDEDSSFSSPAPSSSIIFKKIDDLESAIDKTERPSPISVLESLFTEDDISPTTTPSRPVEKSIQPLQVHTDEEEPAFEYVEAVLLGSGLNWEEYLTSWLCSDPLLHPSLFDEVELFSNQSSDEQKLLFDCTNDVLKELCERYLGHSFVGRNVRPVPKLMDLINEVWEGVEWNLLKQPSPHDLDQLLRKDMAKTGGWMDIRSEAENIAIDLRNSILEDLLDDTILSFVNGDMANHPQYSIVWGDP